MYFRGDNMKIKLFPTLNSVEEEDLKGTTAVVIDVLRATSVITTAVYNGCLDVVPVLEIEDALTYKNEEVLLGGERRGFKIEGFDLSNSPLEYNRQNVEGKRIVFTTSNGTRAIIKAKYCDTILIGSMLNAKYLADFVVKNGSDINIICSGTDGNFSIDDFLCAGKIIYEINKLKETDMTDFATLAYLTYMNNRENIFEYLKYASHYKYMMSIGLEEDIKYCFKEDILDVVPYFKDGSIKKYPL